MMKGNQPGGDGRKRSRSSTESSYLSLSPGSHQEEGEEKPIRLLGYAGLHFLRLKQDFYRHKLLRDAYQPPLAYPGPSQQCPLEATAKWIQNLHRPQLPILLLYHLIELLQDMRTDFEPPLTLKFLWFELLKMSESKKRTT